jgi:anthranilate synthase component 2
VIDKKQVPDEIKITALDSQGEIMALKHKEYDVWGVQFHPESIMTKDGMKILENFLAHCTKNLKASVEMN